MKIYVCLYATLDMNQSIAPIEPVRVMGAGVVVIMYVVEVCSNFDWLISL